jgi:uncharacterized membrane protein
MNRNVIAIHFEDESRAFDALSELKAASAAGLVQLLQAAVVRRDPQGQLQVKEGVVVALDPCMAQLAQSMPAGATALVAIVREFVVEVVDGLARECGGQVQRRPLSELQAEVGSG